MEKVAERPSRHRVSCIFDFMSQKSLKAVLLINSIRLWTEYYSVTIKGDSNFASRRFVADLWHNTKSCGRRSTRDRALHVRVLI